ncbi:MAG: hypothetical protein QXM68_02430 [Candidatus Aenigmatarchaeota archaeon]
MYWTNLSQKIDEERRISSMVDSAFLASNILLSEGAPKYWNETHIVSIGLMNDNRLNQTKIYMLNSFGYYRVKNLLGLDYYDFYFKIYDKSNNTFYEFGKDFSTSIEAVKIKRASIINGKIVFLDLVVWR